MDYGVEGSLSNWCNENHLEDTVKNPDTALGRLFEAGLNGDVTDGDLIPELAGRFCYRAWLKGRVNEQYIGNILDQHHGSVLEHSHLSFAIGGVSRSLSHELVRHRHFNISQESQRYVQPTNLRCVVPPLFIDMGEEGLPYIDNLYHHFVKSTALALSMMRSLDKGASTLERKRVNESCRSVLPNCTETRLFWSGNMRSLRHFFALRGGEAADLEIRRLAVAVFNAAVEFAPNCFQDIEVRKVSDSTIPVLDVKGGSV